jgi:predicted transcriptional regulator
MSKNIRLSLDVSPEVNKILDQMATASHSTKSDVLRKSIALMEVALEEKGKGNHLGVIGKDQRVVKEIVGL